MSPVSTPRGRERPDPKRTHAFLETNDAGMGPAASGGGWVSGNQASVLGVTAAHLRSTRCAVPGCGKERHDPIHAPEGGG